MAKKVVTTLTINKTRVDISSPQKLLYPTMTKKEVVDYYVAISKYMLPFTKGRPIAIQRYPDGIHESSFFQKQAQDYYPDYLNRVLVLADDNPETENVTVENAQSLAYLANLGGIVIHTWQSRQGNLEYPDQMIWDLDPPEGAGFEMVATAARLIKHLLEEMGFEPWLKTSGSKGLHLALPIKPLYHYVEIKKFMLRTAIFLAAKVPELFTTELTIAKRKGRIFIDHLRNQYGHTAACAYSLRAKDGAPVSAPITWDRIEDPAFNSQTITAKVLMECLPTYKCPWATFYEKPFDLVKAYQMLDKWAPIEVKKPKKKATSKPKVPKEKEA